MAKEFKEKTITINLRAVYAKPVTKRAINAKHVLKNAVRKETRMNELKISNKLNELIWGRGRYNAPRKITVKVIAEKEVGLIMLPSEKYEPKKDKKDAKAKTEKKEEKAEEKIQSKKTEEKKETKPAKTEEKK